MSGGEPAVRLRPAREEEHDFLLRLYAGTRADELAQVPWSDEQKAAFCRMQWEAQRAHYERHYPAPPATHDVIECDGALVGRLYVSRGESDIRIVEIALLPEHRGRGIGTRLLRALQEEARVGGRTLSVHVEKMNPAWRLYDRLGFQPVEDKGIYLLMEWRAGR